MKNVKFILPVMVFVMAIGISFASIGLEENVQSQYIDKPTGCDVLSPTVDCAEMGSFVCQVRSESADEVYNVYDNPTCSNPALRGESIDPIEIP